MKTAVTAVQGDFAEHEKVFMELGADCKEIRCKEDLYPDYDLLILPGGESTTQGKLLRELGMFDIIKEKIEEGIPVFATCAGLILLAQNISNDSRRYFASLPVTVKRNAYGRQLGSFRTSGRFGDIDNVPMTFIRAPYIEDVSPDTEILAEVGGNIAAVKYRNQFALSFHPELDPDRRIYKFVLEHINRS